MEVEWIEGRQADRQARVGRRAAGKCGDLAAARGRWLRVGCALVMRTRMESGCQSKAAWEGCDGREGSGEAAAAAAARSGRGDTFLDGEWMSGCCRCCRVHAHLHPNHRAPHRRRVGRLRVSGAHAACRWILLAVAFRAAAAVRSGASRSRARPGASSRCRRRETTRTASDRRSDSRSSDSESRN